VAENEEQEISGPEHEEPWLRREQTSELQDQLEKYRQFLDLIRKRG
jgi:hypothetical protein